MRMAKICGATRLVIYGDSNLVVQQTMNECDAHAANMIAYRAIYNSLEGDFDGYELRHVGREINEEADRLANIGSTCEKVPPGVFLEQICVPSIKRKFPKGSPEEAEHSGATLPKGHEGPKKLDTEVAMVNLMQVMAVEETWTRPYLQYLIDVELPDSPTDARRISRRSKAFTIINAELYKRSILGVLQSCFTIGDGKAILQDIHEGICGHHAGSRSLVVKALRAGFYWPTAMNDAKDIVRRCNGCQRFANKPHAPESELRPIPLAWPFAQWGLVMIGKLPRSLKGGHVYRLVVVDKFTKWIEAMPVTIQKGKTAVKFFESIVYRFGVPHSIITDNGSNFISNEFQDFCEDLGINITYASVAHPQTNGQVEKANGLVGASIKKRLMSPLERLAGAWTKELPSVL